VINKINSSSAGVVAAYNSVTNQFTLTNTSTGDVGINVQDLTGNFLAATGLTPGQGAGTLVSGDNLLYTVGSSTTSLSSQTNTISADSSGITGLTVTPLTKGQFSVTVAPDTTTIGKDHDWQGDHAVRHRLQRGANRDR
jgi:hypothetical protein